MRWIRDIMLLLLLCGIGAGVVYYQSQSAEAQEKLNNTAADTQRLEREVRFRAATKSGELNNRGWPVTVDPAWFDSDPPQNDLVSDDRPWVEIASIEEAGLLHPAVRMTLDEKTAAFWYNPYQGVVRARVPMAITDEVATSMYNAVNQVSIPSVQWRETPVETPKPKQDKAANGKDAGESGDASASSDREPTVVVVRRGRSWLKHQ